MYISFLHSQINQQPHLLQENLYPISPDTGKRKNFTCWRCSETSCSHNSLLIINPYLINFYQFIKKCRFSSLMFPHQSFHQILRIKPEHHAFLIFLTSADPIFLFS